MASLTKDKKRINDKEEEEILPEKRARTEKKHFELITPEAPKKSKSYKGKKTIQITAKLESVAKSGKETGSKSKASHKGLESSNQETARKETSSKSDGHYKSVGPTSQPKSRKDTSSKSDGSNKNAEPNETSSKSKVNHKSVRPTSQPKSRKDTSSKSDGSNKNAEPNETSSKSKAINKGPKSSNQTTALKVTSSKSDGSNKNAEPNETSSKSKVNHKSVRPTSQPKSLEETSSKSKAINKGPKSSNQTTALKVTSSKSDGSNKNAGPNETSSKSDGSNKGPKSSNQATERKETSSKSDGHHKSVGPTSQTSKNKQKSSKHRPNNDKLESQIKSRNETSSDGLDDFDINENSTVLRKLNANSVNLNSYYQTLNDHEVELIAEKKTKKKKKKEKRLSVNHDLTLIQSRYNLTNSPPKNEPLATNNDNLSDTDRLDDAAENYISRCHLNSTSKPEAHVNQREEPSIDTDVEIDMEDEELSPEYGRYMVERKILTTLEERQLSDAKMGMVLKIKFIQNYSSYDQYNIDFMNVLGLYPKENFLYKKEKLKENLTKNENRWEFGIHEELIDGVIENILKFVPVFKSGARASGVVGVSEKDQESNMMFDWPKWAKGFYGRDSTTIDSNKYTLESIDSGLYIAAFRLNWFLTSGMPKAGYVSNAKTARSLASSITRKFPFLVQRYKKLCSILKDKNDDTKLVTKENKKLVKKAEKKSFLSMTMTERLQLKIQNRFDSTSRKPTTTIVKATTQLKGTTQKQNGNGKAKNAKSKISSSFEKGRRNRSNSSTSVKWGIVTDVDMETSPPETFLQNYVEEEAPRSRKPFNDEETDDSKDSDNEPEYSNGKQEPLLSDDSDNEPEHSSGKQQESLLLEDSDNESEHSNGKQGPLLSEDSDNEQEQPIDKQEFLPPEELESDDDQIQSPKKKEQKEGSDSDENLSEVGEEESRNGKDESSKEVNYPRI